MPLEIAHDALAMIEYGDKPAVLLCADSEAGLARARAAAEHCGCRISDAFGIEAAAERLDRQVRTDAVLVDLEQDGGVALDRLLDRLELAALHGRHGSVVAGPATLIDVVAARTPHERVLQLSGAGEAELAAAVAEAILREPARLSDVRRTPARLSDVRRTPARLQQLSEEVGRIASILASLSEDEIGRRGEPGAGEEQRGTIEAGTVRAIIRARRLRDQYFHAELFADPAWDMLLDLFAARLEGGQVAVSSLCIAAAVPATTALRWIKTLTTHGLFVRIADPQDGRRVYIELSEGAARGLEAYLTAVQRLSPLVI